MKVENFLHAGTIGDVYAAIPAMREFFRKTGNKINLYLQKDVSGEYFSRRDGVIVPVQHPTRNEKNEMVMLNERVINMMIPLFQAQDFIKSVQVYKDEEIHCDLNEIRRSSVGMPGLSINRWYFYIYPDLTCDLSGVWLQVPDSEKDLAKGKIIITRSERYNNESIDYSFLKPYEDDCLFCGTMREYNNFMMHFDLNIRMLNINNFLELAQAIKQCKFHITNQTMAFQLSEGQKIPRILEVCVDAPNCIPIGKDAYDFLAQAGLESAFHQLNGTTKQYIANYKLELEAKKKEAAKVTAPIEDHNPILN